MFTWNIIRDFKKVNHRRFVVVCSPPAAGKWLISQFTKKDIELLGFPVTAVRMLQTVICRVNRRQLSLLPQSNRLFSNITSDHVFEAPRLCGSCDCGKVGYEGKGVSCGNFYTHSTAPRHAAASEPESSAYLAAAAFKSNQVSWKGNPINSAENAEYMPPGSSNPHYFCSCEKKQYLGVDATRWLGVVLLNLKRSSGFPASLPDCYRPNHHVFYGNCSPNPRRCYLRAANDDNCDDDNR